MAIDHRLFHVDEEVVRQTTTARVETSPDLYLAEYTRRFGIIQYAGSATTLIDEYNGNRTAYRAAVHPAATWIRDELFSRALADRSFEKVRVVFTAGRNAGGKTTAISFSGATGHFTAAILDSTFSNTEHADRLVGQSRKSDKKITILYFKSAAGRRLDRDARQRAATEGKVVTLDKLIKSQIGAARNEFPTPPTEESAGAANSSSRRSRQC